MTPQILDLPSPTPSLAIPTYRSKIGHLPKKVRDQLNQMLDDGLPHADIKTNLGEHGTHLTVDNISEWKKRGGYKDWLKERLWREEMRARVESFADLSSDLDPSQLPLVGLQMSLTQICEQLRELGPGVRKDQFENNADKYLRMLNTLARLSRSLLTLQQYRDATAQTAARELKKQDPNREFNQPERQAWLDRADDLFNLKSSARLRRELENTPAPPGSADLKSAVSQTCSLPAARSHDSATGSAGLSTDAPQFEVQSSASPPHQSPPPSASALKSEISNLPSQPPDATRAAPIPQNRPSPLPLESSADLKSAVSQTCSLPAARSHDSASASAGVSTGAPQFEVQSSESKVQSSASAPPQSTNPPIHPLLPDHCLECYAILPALLPDGSRPASRCSRCGAELPPPGLARTPGSERCPQCRVTLPALLPDGLRLLAHCLKCGSQLPPPGAAVETLVEHCPGCGARLPATLPSGERPDSYCPQCDVYLPPPLPREKWTSEFCLTCGIDLGLKALSRQRTSETCPHCSTPLPPIPC